MSDDLLWAEAAVVVAPSSAVCLGGYGARGCQMTYFEKEAAVVAAPSSAVCLRGYGATSCPRAGVNEDLELLVPEQLRHLFTLERARRQVESEAFFESFSIGFRCARSF